MINLPIDIARNNVTEAMTWLDEHPKTHSARRGDVRALAADIFVLISALEEKTEELAKVTAQRDEWQSKAKEQQHVAEGLNKKWDQALQISDRLAIKLTKARAKAEKWKKRAKKRS